MQFVRISLALLLFALAAHAQKLTPLAQRPDWASLNKFQGTITKEEFTRLLTQIYAPRGAWQGTFAIADDHVTVATSEGEPPFRLNFAPDAASAKPIPRFWQPRSSLRGLRIALDPGHLGGEWARMEERWFQIGNNKPVTEGDMVVDVAKLLKGELERRGASVLLTRSSSKPATNVRPATNRRPGNLKDDAVKSLRERGRPVNPASIKSESERLFYRTAEIRARARKVNQHLKPDLVLALHFNAESWGNPVRPTLTDLNHLHLLVSGCYSARELAYDDQRYELMLKLLNRSYDKELSVSRAVAQSMARATRTSTHFA